MKHILVIIFLFTLNSALKCQIMMQTNLPPVIPINSEVGFEVKIKKGLSTSFSKYQLEVPRGVVIQETDSKSGTFTYEEGLAKIIWVLTPAESEITVKIKLLSGLLAGKKTLIQKYFYLENEDKKEVEMEPVNFVIKDTLPAISGISESPFFTLLPKAQPALFISKINPEEISTKNPELLKQQVFQLKKDSKDAYEVGEKEKAKAQLKLSEATEAINKAELITNEEEKKAALIKATNDKQKAESDLEVASRVLILAKSLEDNANEIESINKSINPASYTNQNAGGSVTSKEQIPAKDNSLPIKTETVKEEPAAIEKGLVYKIQLGAFSKEPSKSDFKSIGKVSVSSESGMYKVLWGSFISKEEAFKKREEIIAKGFDGFVVSYQDGVRVK